MSNDLVSLDALAIEINALDEQANYHAGQAVIYAARCGEKLLLAKAQCRHGEFESWLDEKCKKVKIRQAQKYMKLAKDMPSLVDSLKTHSSAFLLGINQAIALLTAPEEVKEAAQERLDAGKPMTVKEIQALKRTGQILRLLNKVGARRTSSFAMSKRTSQNPSGETL
jgi:hypothetical protein